MAAARLGIRTLGIESDPHTCRTRRAARHPTLQTDVRTVDPIPARGLIASPPCQTFSTATRSGVYTEVADALDTLASGDATTADPRTGLVATPLEWVTRMHQRGTPYEWIALEQVPTVMPVWRAYVTALTKIGYCAAAGVLSAERYGVPQTRRRAILIARWGAPAALPEPTHNAYDRRDPRQERRDPGVLPWVSIRAALSAQAGLSPPAGKAYAASTHARAATRLIDEPAPTVMFGLSPRDVHWRSHGTRTPVAHAQAALLQSFPSDYPWRGPKYSVFHQIGNAMPPALALAVLKSATGDTHSE